jgi:hypothetical protein
MTSPVPLYKAAAFNNVCRCLQDRIGAPDTWRAILSGLDAATRDVIEHPRPASEWLPAAAWNELVARAEAVLGVTPELFFDVGAASVRQDLKGPYKIFAKLLSVEFLIARVPVIQKMYFKNMDGGIDVKNHAPGHIVIDFRGGPNSLATPRSSWHIQRGALFAFAELTRAKNLSVELLGEPSIKGCAFAVRFDA